MDTITTGIIGIITTVAGIIATFLTLYHKYSTEKETIKQKHELELETVRQKHKLESASDKREAEETAVEQYSKLSARLEAQNARWEADSKEKQKLIEHLVDRDTLCQVRLARYWGWVLQADGWMRQSYERMIWLTAMVKKEGFDVGGLMAPPKLPPEPEDYDDGPNYQARTSKQNTENLKAVNSVVSESAKEATTDKKDLDSSNKESIK